MITAVSDASQVAQARRAVAAFASRLGVPHDRLGQIAIVVTELATNLLKHAGGGEIAAGRFSDADGSGLDVLALDRGSGMADVARCMQDGYSTAGSLGQGLGAVDRQCDRLHIWSQPNLGTAIAARFILQPPAAGTSRQCGSAVAPYPGETACGDDWAVADTPAGTTLLVADGSGHGAEAQRAAQAAVRIFQQHAGDSCEDLVGRLHRGLTPTRGAAVAVARIDEANAMIRYAGVGNISGTLIGDGRLVRMVSHNGTAGHVAPRIREFTYPLAGPPLIVLHSDGISARWDPGGYPGLAARHPSLLAAVLLRDFRRGRDDASVVALRSVRYQR